MGLEVFSLEGKTAIVTGASRGIGASIAIAMAEAGADVALAARSTSDIEQLAGKIEAAGRRAMAITTDVTNPDDVRACVDQTVAAFGKIDILVNNAGITRDNLLMRMDEAEWNDVIATNLAGPFWMCRAVARPMLKAKSGRIINMSSVAGRMGNAGQANYASAKAGLIGLTKTVARELASRGITANAIAPGLIETELTADLPDAARQFVLDSTPLGYIGSVEDVAAAAVYLASDEARYVTGQVLGVDGGMMMGS
jgi:3-oxoacyl-[acyl-carrier protein] reductase